MLHLALLLLGVSHTGVLLVLVRINRYEPQQSISTQAQGPVLLVSLLLLLPEYLLMRFNQL
jgi:hypothetical protein